MLASPSTTSKDVYQDPSSSVALGPYLRRRVGAALWRVADRRVGVVQPVFNAGSFVDFYVGDGEDALTVGA